MIGRDGRAEAESGLLAVAGGFEVVAEGVWRNQGGRDVIVVGFDVEVVGATARDGVDEPAGSLSEVGRGGG